MIKLIKILLAIVILPIVIILRTLCLMANLLVNLSGYIIGPVMTFVALCFVYCIIKTRWTDCGLLFLIEVILFVAFSGATVVIVFVEDLCDSMMSLIRLN